LKINRTIQRNLAALALLSAFSLHPSALLGQGSLTPPGPPAPTMKTADQIEPRTPISSAPFTINVPGSYYLTTNLTVSSGNAITIATNNVTLDLNGFTIGSTTPSAAGTGVLLAGGNANIAILNGFITGGVTNNGSVYGGSGFGYGIFYSGNNPSNVRVSHISVSGCLNDGIHLYTISSTIVESCTVNTVGGTGIYAQSASDSMATSCGDTGINAIIVLNCAVYNAGNVGITCGPASNSYGSSSNSYGVYATTANNCRGSSINGTGIFAGTANNSVGLSTSGTGVYANLLAVGCYGQSSSGTGLFTNIANSCFGYSTTSTGLCANIANSCMGSGNPALAVTNKYNMP
jgi:hypothetical protein